MDRYQKEFRADGLERFTLYWRDGSRNVVKGKSIEDAFTQAGYGGGAIAALDWYDAGVTETHWYNKEKHEIKHLVCSRMYQVRPNDFQQGYSCPHCNPPLPKEGGKRARAIAEMLDGLGVLYEREKGFKGCKLKNVLKFDYFPPEFDLAIEYDGIQHFKDKSGSRISLDEVQKTIARDNAKNQYMRETEQLGLLRIHYQLKEEEILELFDDNRRGASDCR